MRATLNQNGIKHLNIIKCNKNTNEMQHHQNFHENPPLTCSLPTIETKRLVQRDKRDI
jgi:hypothetical protein